MTVLTGYSDKDRTADHQEQQAYEDHTHHSWAVPEGQISKDTKMDTSDDIFKNYKQLVQKDNSMVRKTAIRPWERHQRMTQQNWYQNMENYCRDSNTQNILVIINGRRGIRQTTENISNQEVKQQNMKEVTIRTCRKDQSQPLKECIMIGFHINPRDVHTETILFSTKD